MMKEDEPRVMSRDRDPDMVPRPCCCCLDVRVGTVLIGLFNLVSVNECPRWSSHPVRFNVTVLQALAPNIAI